MNALLLLGLIVWASAAPADAAEMPGPLMQTHVSVRPLTNEPKAHWFGYYDKHQFDPTDRYVLGMQVEFEDRAPEENDVVVLGLIDLEEGDKWMPFAESTAWCWQQGCMLQWLPGSENEVIYNARGKEGYISIVQNVFTGTKRILPKPVYTVSPDGKQALSVNFARLGRTRPGYGYNGVLDSHEDDLHPKEDGIYALDLNTGATKLIVTLNQIASWEPDETAEEGKHWFNHLLYNSDGTRFIFLHRWHRPDGKGWFTRGFTVQPDGGGIHCFNRHGMVSHFIWRDANNLLAWSREPDSGNRFHIYEDQTENVAVVGEGTLTVDGHCTYSPCKKWILTDTYPDRERMQTLILYRISDGKRFDLGRFYQEQPSDVQLRCDLHPRWSRNGNWICIDSRCSGTRQLYLLNVHDIIHGKDHE